MNMHKEHDKYQIVIIISITWYFLGTSRKEPQFFLDFYTAPGVNKYSYLSGKMMVTIL